VGGGPAGLKAAEIAARRGHRVTLFERGETLGGQIRLAARQPEHEIIAGVVDHLETMVRHLGVTIHTSVEATPEMLADQRPDHIVIATGSEPNLPQNAGTASPAIAMGRQVLPAIPGLDLPFVHSSDEVMSGTVRL